MTTKFSIASATATPRRRMALRVAGGLAAAVALFALAGYFGAPPLLKHLIETRASESLGRKVTLDAVAVRPFDLAATLRGLTIFESDSATPMVTLGSVEADASIASLRHLAPVVDSVHIDKLAIRLARDAQGRMSFADIQERLAARPSAPADASPARFSINNIALTESTIVFDDKLLGQTQRVDYLTVTLPFLSNLKHDVEVVTLPTLSAQINGTPLALDGTILPFASSRETHLNVNLDGLDIPQYMPFAPPLTDAVVKSGKLDTRLQVGFRQDGDKQELFVAGTLAVRDADVRKRDGSALVSTGRIAADIARMAPFDREAMLRNVTVDGLAVKALRRADGSLDLAGAFLPRVEARAGASVSASPASARAAATAKTTSPSASAPASASASASAAGVATTPAASQVVGTPASTGAAASAPASAAAPAAGPADAQPWRYAIEDIVVRQARIGLRDEAAPGGPGVLDLGPLDVQVKGFAGDSDKPARLDATLTLADKQTVRHEGELSLRAGTLSGVIHTQGVRPQAFAAWFPTRLQIAFGETGVNAELRYRMAWKEPRFQFALDTSRIALSPLSVALREPVSMPAAAPAASASSATSATSALQSTAGDDKDRQARRAKRAQQRGDLVGDKLPLLRADEAVFEGLSFDLAQQTVRLGAVQLTRPEIAATRDHRGQLLESARIWAIESRNAEGRARADASAPARAPAAAPARNGAASPPAIWKADIGKIAIVDGKLRLADYEPAQANGGRPVVHQFRKISLATGAVAWPLGAAQIPVTLSAETGRRGALSIDGIAAPATPGWQGQVELSRVDMASLQPYLAGRLNAAVRSGTASVKGRVGVAAPAGKPIAATFTGLAHLENVRTVDQASGEDFLRWRTLAVSGIDFGIDESKGPMRLALGNIGLSDFYARVILNANGRLNLQDVAAGGSQKGEAAPGTSLTQANPASAPSAAPGQPEPDKAASKTVANAPKASKPPDSGPKPQIRIGGVKVDRGNINFSDFFVRPNYTANLTGMKGSVSKISTGDPTPADLVLEGRLDDDAPVTISGKLNPLGEQLYLDVAAKAAGVELTRLTPYSSKYAGYPITKGKLTVDLAYKIENGNLQASNHLFLDQLTFGDRVDSPDATKLPVLLAVSLLKDRNGVIDVNLPVSGSLSDPQFSIGGVIGRVIVNLLTKAITSPFTLIASAFGGGGDELGYVEFPAGTSTLTPEARKKVETLGKALNDRPALRLEISGRIDPATDAQGARKAWLDAQVAEQKVRAMRQEARSPTAGDGEDEGEQGAQVRVGAQEYPKYLEAVYKRADFKKPRNVVGLQKSLSTAEMEALLLENAPVTEAGLRQLAEQRALAVKQALERDGKVPEARLFLTASRLDKDGIEDKGAPNRVDFKIRQ